MCLRLPAGAPRSHSAAARQALASLRWIIGKLGSCKERSSRTRNGSTAGLRWVSFQHTHITNITHNTLVLAHEWSWGAASEVPMGTPALLAESLTLLALERLLRFCCWRYCFINQSWNNSKSENNSMSLKPSSSPSVCNCSLFQSLIWAQLSSTCLLMSSWFTAARLYTLRWLGWQKEHRAVI